MVAAAVVMISPESFGPNPQTAASNVFQQMEVHTDDGPRAHREFAQLECRLRAAGVRVHSFSGRGDAQLPDQVFANNWFSTHPDGNVVLYPMLAPNRRAEIRADVIATLRRNYRITRVVDLTGGVGEGRFLEGTGSVVIDHHNGVGFAALSPRTDSDLVATLGWELGLEMICFATQDQAGQPFYHTNVVMSICQDFAIWCPDALADPDQRRDVAARLSVGGRDVIEISLAQTYRFVANILTLNGAGPLIALSETARSALDRDQVTRLADHGELLSVPVPTLERLGGGSLRCMLAEVHLPRRSV